ncbi:MAG: transposase [Phycisphaerae bacterium]
MMKLTAEQLDWLMERIPEPDRSPFGGRRHADQNNVVQGIFWIRSDSAKWKNLPERFGSNGTVRRWFQKWVREAVLEKIMRETGKCAEKRNGFEPYECFIDGTFARTVTLLNRSHHLRRYMLCKDRMLNDYKKRIIGVVERNLADECNTSSRGLHLHVIDLAFHGKPPHRIQMWILLHFLRHRSAYCCLEPGCHLGLQLNHRIAKIVRRELKLTQDLHVDLVMNIRMHNEVD